MARTPSTMQPLGTSMPKFRLVDTEGAVFDSAEVLSGHKDRPHVGTLVIFMCNHCPFVIHLRETLAIVTSNLMARGLSVVGISSNDVENYPQDGPVEMKRERQDAGYQFPYLYDETQEVARAFDAACTPDFFMYDADHTLVYRGQFDGSRPGNDVPVTGTSLLAAADALLATGTVPSTVEQLPSVGCNIKWREP